MAAEERGHRFGVAFEGNVDQLDALLPGNLLHGDVQRRAGARCPICYRSRIGLRGGEELMEGLPWRVAAHHDAERVATQANDVGEILDRVERGPAHEWQPED